MWGKKQGIKHIVTMDCVNHIKIYIAQIWHDKNSRLEFQWCLPCKNLWIS